MSYIVKKAESLFGKTIHDHGLIEDGDRVMVGLSGGKDSLALAWFLARRRKRVPIDFHLAAVMVDMGWEGFDPGPIRDFCAHSRIELSMLRADWSPLEMDSCYPCARARRRLLLETAARAGCNKLALGHNLDDLIETHFLGLIYNGRAEMMKPVQEFKGGIRVIRPLLAVPEHSLARLAELHGLPVQENPCPLARTSARAKVKENLKGLLRLHPKARRNILRGLSEGMKE